MVQNYTLLIIVSVATAVLFGLTLFVNYSLGEKTLITGSAVRTVSADPFTQGANLDGVNMLIFGALAVIMAVTAILLSKKHTESGKSGSLGVD